MIHDLAHATGPIVRETDICIVGAGTAGIFLAASLRKHGLHVVLLEAGESRPRRPEEIGHTVEQRGIRYRGAHLGRSFGLGGTSLLWGGQMIPVAASDVLARPWAGFEAWPIQYEDISRYFVNVISAFGLPHDAAAPDEQRWSKPFHSLSTMTGDFSLRISSWLPFKCRNFAQEFAHSLRDDHRLEVWLNAPMATLDIAAHPGPPHLSHLCSVSASSGDAALVVKAKAFVLCAGALETTRLLLEHDERTAGSITRHGAPLGRYFADHLSATCGTFFRHDHAGFTAAVAPFFDGPIMRTPRLELSAAAQQAKQLPSAFAHVTFRTDGNTGFDVVRSFLRRRQGEQHALGLSPRLFARVTHDVTAMAYWRYARKRLWIPDRAEVLLQVDLEQLPNPESRILLADERDARGRKHLAIDWRITESDAHALRSVTRLASVAWNAARLDTLATLNVSLDDCFDSFETMYDVYHPTGTIRMGNSPANSVVDRNLRLWAIDNCFVSSTAVFPSAGSANPGFTHLALTARLADHLATASA